MTGLGTNVSNAVATEARLKLDRAEGGGAVGEDALRRSDVREDAFEYRRHMASAPTGDALERDQAAAVIVDDTQYPYREDAQDPEGREVEAPELARAGDADSSRAASDLVFESGHEVAAPRDDASECLLGCSKAEHAGCEMAQLSFAELRLLDVEPHDRGLD
jgi:hypothetical protein